MNINISAIVVTYNSAVTIYDCIVSLKDSLDGQKAEIIIVDNDSKDNTCEIIRNVAVNAKVLYMPKNIGFAAGVNKGISCAQGHYLLIVNPDLIINSECVNGMLQFLKENSKAGVIAPKLVYPSGEIQPSCRRYPTLRALLLRRIGFMKHIFGTAPLASFLMEDKYFEAPTEVEWLIGACIMIKRRAIEDVGFFDEHFFLYYEDLDWCYRAQKHGWKIYYLPKLKSIHHYKRASARGLNRETFLHFRSMLHLFNKHGFRF